MTSTAGSAYLIELGLTHRLERRVAGDVDNVVVVNIAVVDEREVVHHCAILNNLNAEIGKVLALAKHLDHLRGNRLQLLHRWGSCHRCSFSERWKW
jgi:hypothetical protein